MNNHRKRLLEPETGKTIYYVEDMVEGDIGLAKTPMIDDENHITVYEYRPDKKDNQCEWHEVGRFWNKKHAKAFAHYMLTESNIVDDTDLDGVIDLLKDWQNAYIREKSL